MPDEVVIPEGEEEEGTDPEENNGKTFSKAEVESIVKSRLAAASKKHKRELDAVSETVTEREAEMETYKAAFEEQVKVLKENLPAAVLKLLEKLPLTEQFSWLSDPENVKPTERKAIPSTPSGEPGETPKKVGLPVHIN